MVFQTPKSETSWKRRVDFSHSSISDADDIPTDPVKASLLPPTPMCVLHRGNIWGRGQPTHRTDAAYAKLTASMSQAIVSHKNDWLSRNFYYFIISILQSLNLDLAFIFFSWHWQKWASIQKKKTLHLELHSANQTFLSLLFILHHNNTPRTRWDLWVHIRTGLKLWAFPGPPECLPPSMSASVNHQEICFIVYIIISPHLISYSAEHVLMHKCDNKFSCSEGPRQT